MAYNWKKKQVMEIGDSGNEKWPLIERSSTKWRLESDNTTWPQLMTSSKRWRLEIVPTRSGLCTCKVAKGGEWKVTTRNGL